MAYVGASFEERRVLSRLSLVVLVFAVACGPPSIEQLCEEVSSAQCAACFSCEIDGSTACDLPDDTSESECADTFTARCVGQAATLERPKRELGECSDSLDELSCDVLVRGATQDAPYTTDACVYFL